MPFLRKFQNLLEIDRGDVTTPDYVWLVYAACALSDDACGWSGWMIDAAFKGPDDGSGNYPSSTGDEVLPSMDCQVCPRCGMETYRTGADIRMMPSEEQDHALIPGVHYQVSPIEYEG